jgi:hypothetical protein
MILFKVRYVPKADLNTILVYALMIDGDVAT